MIYCFSTHSASIRTIPALQHDPDKMEDVNSESEDHAADEWRYACMSRPFSVPAVKTPPQIVIGYGPKVPRAPGDWMQY